MVRINLLPPEIQERRRWDRYYPLVFLIGFVAFAAIGAVAFGLLWYTNGERATLQEYKSQAADLEAQAAQFAVFEQKESDLVHKASMTQEAMSGRVNWAALCRDISMVLPDEVWLISIQGNEDTGVQLSGYTPNANPGSSAESYKSIAKMLVLLNALPQLYDVWLTNATVAEYSNGTSTEGAPTLQFQATAKVVKASTTATGTPTAVLAPPSSGQ
jgi:Tfp pilus assembly protein PilN